MKCYYCKKEIVGKGTVVYPSPHGKSEMCSPCRLDGLKSLLKQSEFLKSKLERKVIDTKKEIKEEEGKILLREKQETKKNR